MTRLIGLSLIKTPCCGATVATHAYASHSYHFREFWTDGPRDKGLPTADGDLRHCKCGQYYLLGQCEYLGITHRCDVGDFHKFYAQTPPAMPVSDYHLAEAIAVAAGNAETETVVRRRYWQVLNDDYRRLSTAALGRWPAKDVFEPDAIQTENMKRLLVLLEASADHNWFEVAELQRELGMPEKARVTMEQVPADQQHSTRLMRTLLDDGIQGPRLIQAATT